MDEERFQQLLTKLVVKLAKQFKPEVYTGSDESVIEGLNKNEEHKTQIMTYIKERGEAGELEKDLMEVEQEQEQSNYLKNGGKLDYLQSLKKGGKIKSKKCACGCDLIMKKEKGGKMIQSCACGCKPKYEKGGKIQKLAAGDQIKSDAGYQIKSAADYYRQKSNIESQKASLTNLKNTISDFFRYGDLNYVPKTQYWYDAKKKSGMLKQSTTKPVTRTASFVNNKTTQIVAPKTETVTTPTAKTETKVPANVTTQTAVQPNANVSIVDYLNSLGQDSSRTARQALAKQLGMTSYSFSGADNLKLLELAKNREANRKAYTVEKTPLNVVAAPINAQATAPILTTPSTPAVPGLQPRQGFNRLSVMDTYAKMYSTPAWMRK